MRFLNPEVEALLDLYFQLPEDNNLLLIGPPGTGKTMVVFQKAEEYGKKVFAVTGRESLQDIDMLGSFVPDGSGGFRWVDGPLTQAFRSAGQGEKVLFLMDEVNRMPTRYQNIFIEAINIYDARNYVLRNYSTGETLLAPRQNLLFCATANVGQLGIYDIPQALIDRFNIVHVDYPPPRVEKKLVTSVMGKENSLFIQVLTEFVLRTRRIAYQDGTIEPLSTRSLLRVAKQFKRFSKDLSDDEEKKNVLFALLRSEILKMTGLATGPEAREVTQGFKEMFEETYKKILAEHAGRTVKKQQIPGAGLGTQPLQI